MIQKFLNSRYTCDFERYRCNIFWIYNSNVSLSVTKILVCELKVWYYKVLYALKVHLFFIQRFFWNVTLKARDIGSFEYINLRASQFNVQRILVCDLKFRYVHGFWILNTNIMICNLKDRDIGGFKCIIWNIWFPGTKILICSLKARDVQSVSICKILICDLKVF